MDWQPFFWYTSQSEFIFDIKQVDTTRRYKMKNHKALVFQRNGWYFAAENLKYIFIKEIFCILFQISLMCVPMGQIHVIPRQQTGDNPLFKPMMTIYCRTHTPAGLPGRKVILRMKTTTTKIMTIYDNTVKPVYNNHLMGYFSAFWSSSRWPRAT